MVEEVKKPEWISEEALESVLAFLDDLRETGVTNMFGATPYIEDWWTDEYPQPLERGQSRELLSYWMKTFSGRHAKG